MFVTSRIDSSLDALFSDCSAIAHSLLEAEVGPSLLSESFANLIWIQGKAQHTLTKSPELTAALEYSNV